MAAGDNWNVQDQLREVLSELRDQREQVQSFIMAENDFMVAGDNLNVQDQLREVLSELRDQREQVQSLKEASALSVAELYTHDHYEYEQGQKHILTRGRQKRNINF